MFGIMKKIARIVKGTDLLSETENQKELIKHVNENNLIGIPTETVYGLGGNSMNEISLKKIYEMKKRPTSDPIISHVFNLSQAFEQLYEINIFEKYILYMLNKHFWPGPLSVIAKAKKEVPLLLTANTGFCAVRIPNNTIAREIIKLCEIPIAAPSANKFQHISPTTALHVFEEFENENIIIYDDGQCEIGIESTVVKLVKYRKNEKQDGTSGEKHREKEEVITDFEYVKEKEEELKQLRLLENTDQELINNKESKSLMDRLKVYDYLKLLFEDINKEKEKNSYVYQQMLKYKNLYEYSIIIYRRGKYTKQEIENVIKIEELLKDIKVDLSEKIKFESFTNCNEKKEKVHKTLTNSVTCLSDDDKCCLNGEKKEECKNIFNHDNSSPFYISTEKTSEKIENKNNECNNFISPGMMLTHYSPSVSTYMINNKYTYNNGNLKYDERKKKEYNLKCKDCVLLDIGNSLSKYERHFLKYINIFHDPEQSETHHINYTTKHFFSCLREAERYAVELKGQSILISIINLDSSSEKWLSLFDRIFRACSGKELFFFCNEEDVTLLCNS